LVGRERKRDRERRFFLLIHPPASPLFISQPINQINNTTTAWKKKKPIRENISKKSDRSIAKVKKATPEIWRGKYNQRGKKKKSKKKKPD
jgi:hypothetical protein